MYDFISIVGPDTEFVGADGKTYRLSPLGFGEIAEYILWYQYKEYTDFKAVMEQAPLSPDLRSQQELEVFKRCQEKKLAPESRELIESYTTNDGIEMQLYLSLRASNPKFKRSDLSKIINQTNLLSTFKKLEAITGIFPVQEANKETPGEL